MKGKPLMACIAVGLAGVSLLLLYPPGPEPELRDPPINLSMCELVRKYEPNQPLREHICRPQKVREKLEEQHGVREPEGMEEQQRVREPEVTIKL
jgi:hypothetical protein